RLADFRQPELAVEARFRDLLSAVPHIGLADHFRIIVAGKAELAGEVAVLVLVDHAAHRIRIFAGEGAVQHHLRHRDLAAYGFAAGLEIDRLSTALFRP